MSELPESSKEKYNSLGYWPPEYTLVGALASLSEPLFSVLKYGKQMCAVGRTGTLHVAQR